MNIRISGVVMQNPVIHSLNQHLALFRNLVSAIHKEKYLNKNAIEKILMETNFQPLISQAIQLSNTRDAAFNKLMEGYLTEIVEPQNIEKAA